MSLIITDLYTDIEALHTHTKSSNIYRGLHIYGISTQNHCTDELHFNTASKCNCTVLKGTLLTWSQKRGSNVF